MTYINPIFKTSKVRSFLNNLIRYYNYRSFEQFSMADKCHFVSLLLDALGRDSETEFFVESQDAEDTIDAFKKALAGTHDDDENFIYQMKEHAIKYYNCSMRALFKEAIDAYQSEMKMSKRELSPYIGVNIC